MSKISIVDSTYHVNPSWLNHYAQPGNVLRLSFRNAVGDHFGNAILTDLVLAFVLQLQPRKLMRHRLSVSHHRVNLQ